MKHGSHAGTNRVVDAPAVITTYAVTELPTGLTELRRFEVPGPLGATAHIRWFSELANGPTLTTNLTTGSGAGPRALATARSLANQHVADSRASGTSIPAPVDITINGNPGIAYSDPLGWRVLTWVVDADHAMSVTGLKLSDTALRNVAHGIQFA